MAVSTSRVLLYILLVRQFVTGSTCSSGFFLRENRNCTACPEHCLDCDSEDYCLYCEKGYWGKVCELSCSDCMKGTSCEKTNGFCKEGCAYGYSGLLCNVKCDNKCVSCNRENPQNCSKCATGRYPAPDCDKICSGCHEQNCDETGICALRCVEGFWGQSCEEMCSPNCTYTSCDRDNGTCIAIYKNPIHVPVISFVVAAAFGTIVVVVITYSVSYYFRRRRKKSRMHSQPAEAEELPEGITAADQKYDGASRSTYTTYEADRKRKEKEDELEEENRYLKSREEQLEKQNKDIEKKNRELEEEVRLLNKKLERETYEADRKRKEKEDELEEENRYLKRREEQLERQNEDLEKTNRELEEEVCLLNKKPEREAGGVLQGVTTGELIGAAIGSVAGPVGTTLGGLAGALAEDTIKKLC